MASICDATAIARVAACSNIFTVFTPKKGANPAPRSLWCAAQRKWEFHRFVAIAERVTDSCMNCNRLFPP